MRVRVDQTRHKHLAAAIDHIFRLKFLFEVSFRSNSDNGVTTDSDCAGIVLIEFFIHRQDDGVYE